jgi:predicted nuclease of predicted toxin-antitoxin system
MKFKVDENQPRETCELLNRAGHVAISVGRQAFSCAVDSVEYRRCQDEQRALITLDMDFANVQVLEREPLDKRLWVVEHKRIRIRQ